MFTEVTSSDHFDRLKGGAAALAYFSAETCSACHALKPKVEEMIVEQFPKMKLAHIQSDKLPEIAAKNRVFTAPTVLIFFEGREYIRKSRSFGIVELKQEIDRFYKLLF